MLRKTIDDIIFGRLPETEVRQHLLSLTVDKLDEEVIGSFVDAVKATLDDESRALSSLDDVIDCSGTGGSGLPHFNTSTTVAFILAAGGVRVAKFGNRAAQSASGSFDLLEQLGMPLSVPAAAVPELMEQLGLVFLFAQQYYACLSKLAPLRKSLGVKTVFNTIGPLLNPAEPSYRVMGTSDERAQALVASHLSRDKSVRKAFVVRSISGMDELEPGEENKLLFVEPEKVADYPLHPRPCVHDVAIRSFTSRDNMQLFHSILSTEAPPYFRELVCINAGAGFVAAGKSDTVDAGAVKARELLASGAVKNKYEQCRRAYAAYTG